MGWLLRLRYWLRAGLFVTFFTLGMGIGWVQKSLRWLTSDTFLRGAGAFAAIAVAASGVYVAKIANDILSKQTEIMMLEYAPVWEVDTSLFPDFFAENRNESLLLKNYGGPATVSDYTVTTYWSIDVDLDQGDGRKSYRLFVPVEGYYQIHTTGSVGDVEAARSIHLATYEENPEFLNNYETLQVIESDIRHANEESKIVSIQMITQVSFRYTDKSQEMKRLAYNNESGTFSQIELDKAREIDRCRITALINGLHFDLDHDKANTLLDTIEKLIELADSGSLETGLSSPVLLEEYSGCISAEA